MKKTEISNLISNNVNQKRTICKSLNDIICQIRRIKKEMYEDSYTNSKDKDFSDKMIKLNGYDEIWFRGSDRLKYKLLPSSYREACLSYDQGWELFDIFESYIPMFLKKGNFIEPKNVFDNYFLARHYGMKTRLLDWTRSLSTSIFFSIQKFLEEEKEKKETKCDCKSQCKYNKKCNYPTIWVLNASLMNDVFHDIGNPLIPDLNNESHKWFIKENIPENPLAIFPSVSNERILAQQGVFTVHGKHEDSLDELLEHYIKNHNNKSDNLKILDFILIDPKSISQIIDELTLLGINEMTEFPELESVIKFIMRQFNKDFDIDKYKK